MKLCIDCGHRELDPRSKSERCPPCRHIWRKKRAKLRACGLLKPLRKKSSQVTKQVPCRACRGTGKRAIVVRPPFHSKISESRVRA